MDNKPRKIKGPSAESAEALARFLDYSFKIPGINRKFGFDAIIGLIPVVGDFTTSLLSLLIIFWAANDGVSRWTIIRMFGNILVDTILSSVPLIGDFADFIWRANLRNLELWQEAKQAKRYHSHDKWFVILLALGLLMILAGALYLSIQILVWLRQLIISM